MLPELKLSELRECDQVRCVKELLKKLAESRKSSKISLDHEIRYEEALVRAEKVVDEVSKSIKVRKHMPGIWGSDLKSHREALAQMSQQA